MHRYGLFLNGSPTIPQAGDKIVIITKDKDKDDARMLWIRDGQMLSLSNDEKSPKATISKSPEEKQEGYLFLALIHALVGMFNLEFSDPVIFENEEFINPTHTLQQIGANNLEETKNPPE